MFLVINIGAYEFGGMSMLINNPVLNGNKMQPAQGIFSQTQKNVLIIAPAIFQKLLILTEGNLTSCFEV